MGVVEIIFIAVILFAVLAVVIGLSIYFKKNFFNKNSSKKKSKNSKKKKKKR